MIISLIKKNSLEIFIQIARTYKNIDKQSKLRNFY